MIRQGDLFFVKTEEIPSDAQPIEGGVIARGEATGHTHRVRSGTGIALMVAGVTYVRALAEAFVDHQEHSTIILPPGNWEVFRQREYTPKGWVRVDD